MLNRILPTRSRSGSRNSPHAPLDADEYGAAGPSTPQMDTDSDQFSSSGFGNNPRRISSGVSAWGQKLSPRTLLAPPTVPRRHVDHEVEGVPREMIPALTLLAAHGSRVYIEGYFMLLAELNAEGQPVANPHWIEVFGTLQGTVITMWDAALLEEGRHDTSFINVGDGYMRSVESLGNNLQNIIVLSTTMKNRYLLQFGTKKLFNEWTAALRLAFFERTALQEAYTGALLSAKGARLHGVRALLAETKFKQESWCQVRFGVGMPWRHVWAVTTPNAEIREKKERKRRGALGKVELFNDPRDARKKKAPVATIERVSAAFAVFPEKSVLVNVSSLVKMEGFVLFENEHEERESAIFIMPDPHPGVEGFETLIRFLIPILDVFGLYGRPQRLNADKNDIKSLLFGMPTLPRAHYLDVIDVYMLATLGESADWSASEWNNRIKELIARKMAMGFRGTGSVSQSGSGSESSSLRNSPARQRKPRAVSDPNGAKLFATPSPNDTSTTAASSTSSLVNKQHVPAVPSPLQHSRPAPKAPSQLSQPPQLQPASSGTSQQTAGPAPASPAAPPAPVQVYPQPSGYATDASTSMAAARRAPAGSQAQAQPAPPNVPIITTEPSAPRGPRPGPGPSPNGDAALSATKHSRTKSEGGDRIPGLLTPQLGDESERLDNDNGQQQLRESPHSSRSRPTLDSADSFASASDGGDLLDFGLNGDATNVFDPTYRPAHQSYADYSEYMKQYLNRSLGNGEAIATSRPVREEEEGISAPTTPRAKANGTAKLLDTPIRTPELSVAGTPTAAEESARKAGDSPPSDALDSLTLPKPVSGVGAQRRPSGPRPDPTQSPGQAPVVRKPAPGAAGLGAQSRVPVPGALRVDSSSTLDDRDAYSDAQTNPYAPPSSTQKSIQDDAQRGPVPGARGMNAPGGYGAGPSGPSQSGLAPTGPRQPFLGQDGMFIPSGYDFQPPGRRGSPGPRGSPELRGSPGPGFGPRQAGPQGGLMPQMRHGSNPYAPPPSSFGGPLGGPGGPAAPGGYAMPPAGYAGTPPAGYNGPPAPPAGYGAPPPGSFENTSMPGSLPFERNIMPYGPGQYGAPRPSGPPAPQQQGSAKTGPPIRPLNEVRAQQLRDTRAQAKNNGGYPSFH